MNRSRTIHLVGAPLGYAGGEPGTELGPHAIRIAGLHKGVEGLGLAYRDAGNVDVVEPLGGPGHPLDIERTGGEGPKALFLKEVLESCARIRDRVGEVLEEGGFPVVVGGDHSIACGTIAALSTHHHRRDESIGLIWFDAHADMNTPDTSPSGNVHGMPLAAVLGMGPEELVGLGERTPMVDAERSVLIGIRDVDPAERPQLEATGIRVYSMRELDELGMARVAREALEIVTDGTAGFHLSFDLDGCDPVEAPGVGTPVRGGVTHREAHLLMECAADTGKLVGLEMAEVNPILDYGNRTAEFAVELILSALGKRIW